jgi:hypothetical protein
MIVCLGVVDDSMLQVNGRVNHLLRLLLIRTFYPSWTVKPFSKESIRNCKVLVERALRSRIVCRPRSGHTPRRPAVSSFDLGTQVTG